MIEINNKIKTKTLNYLARHLSFTETLEKFPFLSTKDLQNILNDAAEQFSQKEKINNLSSQHEDLTIYTDGASRGNPGEAGAGIIIYNQHKNILKEISRYLGRTTNNYAEYKAFILALQESQRLNAKKLKIFSDSELLVKQINGEYKVKNETLKELFSQAKELITFFQKVSITHIPRAKNAKADSLANQAIDEAHLGKQSD